MSIPEGSARFSSSPATASRPILYEAIIRMGRAALRESTREGLCQAFCRAAVEQGGFVLASVGWHDQDRGDVVPFVGYGTTGIHPESQGQGPLGIAIRTARPYVCNDFSTEGGIKGIRSAAAFPIRIRDAIVGAVMVCAGQPDYFQRQEVELLQEAALDMSFALSRLARDDDARSQFEAVVAALQDGVVIYDFDGNLLQANAAASAILNVIEPQAAFGSLRAFENHFELATLEGRAMTPDEWPATRLIRGETLREFEARVRRLDVAWERVISFSGTTIQHAGHRSLVFLTLKDVTDRKEAEEALRFSERRLQHAQEIAKVGSWDMELPSGKVFWSDELYNIFGMNKQECAPDYEEFLRRVPPEDRARIETARRRVLAGESGFDLKHRFMLPDGSVKYLHATGQLTGNGGGPPTSLTAAVLDITAQQEAENALRDANAHLEIRVRERTQELGVAKERAESADRLKSAFLATMSHELRTPLNSIIGFTGIVIQGMAGPLTTEQSHQLGMVRSSARHLLSLINDVLDISKIEAGQLEIRAAPFDLRASAERLIGSMMPLANKKNLRLRLVSSPGLGLLVSDQRRIEQIMLNLVNNAIKFTDRGEVELSVELIEDCAMGRGTGRQPCIRFRVRDSGIGIQESDLPHLFKPFHQIDTGLTRKHEGTGLGLAICGRLADLLGGEMSVQSRFGAGSLFAFTVPVSTRGPMP